MPLPKSVHQKRTSTHMTKDDLLQDALEVLGDRARRGELRRKAWRERLDQITANLALEDSMAAELRMPRAARRRELVGIIERLRVVRRRGTAWGGKRLTLSPATAADIRIVWPRFTERLLNCSRPGVASAVLVRLHRALAALDGNHYGTRQGRDRDLALAVAAAALLDLLNDVKGKAEGTLHSTSRDGAWHHLLCRVAEAAGRQIPNLSARQGADRGKGGEDRTHVLETVREDVLGRERQKHRS
jgi:hypothetical protein